jgi:hypothetical protein
MGPVGYDIGCSMVSDKSDVAVDAATPKRRLVFSREVMSVSEFEIPLMRIPLLRALFILRHSL